MAARNLQGNHKLGGNMNVTFDGNAVRRGDYGLQGDVLVAGAPVASITFSGLDNIIPIPRIAMQIRWNHESTGAQRLDLEINGDAAPAGSKMIRNQYETTLGTREDRLDPGFTAADLIAVAAGTQWEGMIYFLGDPSGRDKAVAEADGYARDAAILLADRERFLFRQGRWNAIVTSLSSTSLVVASGSSVIAVGSQILLFA